MSNALQELISHLEEVNKELLCIHIRHEVHWDEETHKTFYLPINYTSKQNTQFRVFLSFEYDSGYGTQYLYGTIWFKDGSWSERYEYDGSEYWIHKSTPEIPEQCKE